MSAAPPHCLTIAGSDSGGAAGIQADLKTFTALGTYGSSVITALTSQNTQGVHGVSAVDAAFVASQLESVLSDMSCSAFKTGMLHNAEVIKAVVECLKRQFPTNMPPFVLDPVMVSTSGHTLLDESAIETLRHQLVPLATIVTPNLPEAAILAGRSKSVSSKEVTLDDIKLLARSIGELGCKFVLVKGGHARGDELFDVLYDVASTTFTVFRHRKIDTTSLHGTGCTLSAALCAFLAKGFSVRDATELAIDYLQGALRAAYPLGHGAGPVNHLFNIVQRPVPLPTRDSPHPFTDYLIQACRDEWEEYVWDNAFVQGLKDGTLPMDSFTHFLKQDYHFLLHYARIHAMAAYKCDTFEEIEACTDIVQHITRESKLHVATCAKRGISLEDMLAEPEGELTVAYTRYVLDIAHSKSLLHLRVATAPCLLGYGEIANRLLASPELKREGNPYMYWIEEYGAADFQDAVRKGRDLLEEIASRESLSPSGMKELVQIFATATRLECGFFEQGLRKQYRIQASNGHITH